jgi:chemotaxis protein methyltransferase CheR
MVHLMDGNLDHLSGRDFGRLAKFIQDYSGIKMPPTKKTMVEGRLRKRVAAAGFRSLAEYCHNLFDGNGLATEAVHLIDVVTTNKTEFFREPEHFRVLVDVAMPQVLAARRAGPYTQVKVWSTASSIGAEPYTLAMVLDDLSRRCGGFRVSIVATDLSTRVLETAAMAIYPEAMIAPIPPEMRKRYLLRSKGTQNLVRVIPELRRMVQFGRLNLMDETYPVDRDMDVIFCRNMLIYFDKPTQQAVLQRLCGHLRPGGFFFLGHSETLAGFGLPLKPVGNTVFFRE